MNKLYTVLAGWGVMIIIIFIASLQPNLAPDNIYHFDKIVHFFAYAFLTFIPASQLHRKTVFVMAIALFILSYIIEVIQQSIPGRMGSYADLLANGLGIITGWYIGRLYRHIRLKRKKTKHRLLRTQTPRQHLNEHLP